MWHYYNMIAEVGAGNLACVDARLAFHKQKVRKKDFDELNSLFDISLVSGKRNQKELIDP